MFSSPKNTPFRSDTASVCSARMFGIRDTPPPPPPPPLHGSNRSETSAERAIISGSVVGVCVTCVCCVSACVCARCNQIQNGAAPIHTCVCATTVHRHNDTNEFDTATATVGSQSVKVIKKVNASEIALACACARVCVWHTC